MQQDLARARRAAGELLAVQIHQAHVAGFQIGFARQGRRAITAFSRDAIRNIAAVAVYVLAQPQLATYINDLRFDLLGFGRIENFVPLTRRRSERRSARRAFRAAAASAVIAATALHCNPARRTRILRRWRQNCARLHYDFLRAGFHCIVNIFQRDDTELTKIETFH